MPFFDDAPAAGLPLLSPEPTAVTPPAAPFSRLFDSAMRRDNLVGSITEAATQPPMGAFDPSFDPWAKIEGYEDYARSFIGANSDDDVLHVKARIDKERRDEELLSNGGWRGTAALLAAGTLDPTNLIPLGQVRAVTRGGRALEGVIRGGAALGAGSALQEVGLQGSQITRPASESLMSIGSASVLGGVLGGAVGALTRPTTRLLRELGDSSAIGGMVFDRELAANLPGRRNLEEAAVVFDANAIERAKTAAGGDVAKVAEDLRTRIDDELSSGAIVEHRNQGGEKVAITAIDEAGILTDANGARLTLDDVTSPGHSLEIRTPSAEAARGVIGPLVDDPLALHQRGDLSAARAAEIRDMLATLSPEETARLQAAGVPLDPEMWKVVADNLAKAEASREGGLAVVIDQAKYLRRGGDLDNLSEREAFAVINQAMQAEVARGGDPSRFLDDAIAAGLPGARVPGWVADWKQRLLYALPEEPRPIGLGRQTAEDVLTAVARRHGIPIGGTVDEMATAIVGKLGHAAAIAEAERLAAEHTALMRGGAGGRRGIAAESGAGIRGVAGREPAAGTAGADGAGLPAGGRGAGAATGGSVGAARVLDTSLDQETIASALGIEKALVRTSPTLRTGTSPLIETRRIANELADQPLDLKKNVEGIPTAQSVESLIKQFRGPLAEAEVGVDDLFVQYRLGHARRPFDIARLEARDMFGRPQGAMSYDEFRQAISRAMRRGDQSTDPEVAAAAKLMREKVFDPLKERAIAAELLPADIDTKTAESYLMRVYDANKIVAQRGQFSDVITRWLGGEQAKKDTIRTRVVDLLEEFDELSDRISRREGQIEGREQTLRETEVRREEASRFNAFAFRRSQQMSQPVDQLRADIRTIETQIAPQLQRLEELRTAIAAEKDRFPQLREIDAAMYRLIGAGQKLKQGGELVDLVRDSDEVVSAIEDVRAAVRGGIRELSTERTTARQALGAFDLVALEKTRTDLGQAIGPYRTELRRLQRELRDEMQARGGPARGGAVFETEIRRRGNVLADQESGRGAAIEGIRERLARDQQRLDAIQTEFEKLVTSWEGETSRTAKAALAQRAEQEATRTPEQGRLAAADKPVIEAAKAIAGANTRLEEIELRDIARQIIDRILGSPVGRLPYDMEVPHPSGGAPRPDRAAPRGPLAQRAFMIPDELIEPWLENDSRQIARAYNRTMAPDVLLAERFGRTDMEAQFQEIQAGYERLRAGKSEAEQQKLHAAMTADLRDLKAMRDRLRGTYGLPENPNGLANRIYHVIRDLNYLRLLGGMTISAIPDMGRTVMQHGFSRVFGDGMVPMLTNFREFQLAAKETKLAGTALDMVLDTRAMSMADMLDDYGRWSKYERGLKGLTDKFGFISLMAPWNSAMKQIAGVIGQTRTLEAVEALVAGQPLRQAERTRLASLGIGSEMAERIDAEFKTHGAKQNNGTWWANTEAWTDNGARESFRSALNKEIDATIVTQGQEIPLWMTGSSVGRMIGQFRTFGVASAQRVMMSGLQKRDMATLNGAALMVGLGMMVYAIRHATNPRAQPLPDPTTPAGLARWIREGVDISGLTGWLFDVHNMVEKASGGGIGISRLTGGPAQSRYANRNTLESILGPTAGLIQDAGQLLGATTKGEWSAGDGDRVRRMIPFQNLIGIRHAFDAAEHGINNAMGIREPPPRR